MEGLSQRLMHRRQAACMGAPLPLGPANGVWEPPWSMLGCIWLCRGLHRGLTAPFCSISTASATLHSSPGSIEMIFGSFPLPFFCPRGLYLRRLALLSAHVVTTGWRTGAVGRSRRAIAVMLVLMLVQAGC